MRTFILHLWKCIFCDYSREVLAFEYLKTVCQHFESSPSLGTALVLHIELLLQRGKVLLSRQKIEDVITGTSLLPLTFLTAFFRVVIHEMFVFLMIFLSDQDTIPVNSWHQRHSQVCTSYCGIRHPNTTRFISSLVFPLSFWLLLTLEVNLFNLFDFYRMTIILKLSSGMTTLLASLRRVRWTRIYPNCRGTEHLAF